MDKSYRFPFKIINVYWQSIVAIKQKLQYVDSIFCIMFYLQVEVDWEKINAKIDMELQKEAAKPGAKPYNG